MGYTRYRNNKPYSYTSGGRTRRITNNRDPVYQKHVNFSNGSSGGYTPVYRAPTPKPVIKSIPKQYRKLNTGQLRAKGYSFQQISNLGQSIIKTPSFQKKMKASKVSIISNSRQDTAAKLSHKFNIKRSRVYTGSSGASSYNRTLKKSPISKSILSPKIKNIITLNKRPNQIIKQPLISESSKTTKTRSKLNLLLSPKSDKKNYLMSLRKNNPKAFNAYLSGSASVFSSTKLTPSKTIHTKENRKVSRLRAPSSYISTIFSNTNPFTSANKKVDVTTIKGKKVERTFKLMNNNFDNTRNKKLIKAENTKNIDTANKKGLADFKNTILKQKQNSKRIKEYNNRPLSQQNPRELNLLNQQQKDIQARFKLNPYVTTKNGQYIFKSGDSKVIDSAVLTTTYPNKKYDTPVTQFDKGYREAANNKPISRQALHKLSPYQGIQRISGEFTQTIVSGKAYDTGGKVISRKTLTPLGVNKKISNEIGSGIGYTTSQIPLLLVGGGIGKGIGIAAKGAVKGAKYIPGVSKITKGISVFSKNKKVRKTAKITLGLGAAAYVGYGVGSEAYKGSQETGTVAGTLAYGAVGAAKVATDFAVFNRVVGGTVSGYTGKPITTITPRSDIKKAKKTSKSLIIQSNQIKNGKGVTVTVNQGHSLTGINKGKMTSVSEGSGTVNLPTGESVKYKSISKSNGNIKKINKKTQQLPTVDTKVTYIGTNKAPTFIKSNTETVKSSNGDLTSSTISKNLNTNKKSLTRAKLEKTNNFNNKNSKSLVPGNSQYYEFSGYSKDTGNILGNSNRINSFFRGQSTMKGVSSKVSHSQFSSATISDNFNPGKVVSSNTDLKLKYNRNINAEKHSLHQIRKTKHLSLTNKQNTISFKDKSNNKINFKKSSKKEPVQVFKQQKEPVQVFKQQKEPVQAFKQQSLSEQTNSHITSQEAKANVQKFKSQELAAKSKEYNTKSKNLAEQRKTDINKKVTEVSTGGFLSKLKSIIGIKSKQDIISKGKQDIIPKGKQDIISKGKQDIIPKGKQDIKSVFRPQPKPVFRPQPKPVFRPDPTFRPNPEKIPSKIEEGIGKLPTGAINLGQRGNFNTQNRYINNIIHNPIQSLSKK